MTVNDVDALPLREQRQRHLLLDDLDPDQYEAVTTPAGVVVVRAGAGSGKTTVLTRRIAYRLDTETATARHVLAITFTRQAAGELRRRLRMLTGDAEREANLVTAGTFHAIALSLLRQRREDQGKAMPNVLNNRLALLSAARGTEKPGDESHDILNMIDWAHARLLSPADVVKRLEPSQWRLKTTVNAFAEIFHAYENVKRKRGVLDLNDMISLVVREAQDQPQFAESIRWQFRHVHVDEAQDMNPLQYSFLQLLIGERPDAFLVGDPNQAIYGFNGADSTLFADLPGVERGARIVPLPSNYRCTPEIVDFAVAALARDEQPTVAASMRPPGDPVRLERCADETEEARRIVAAVREAVAEGRRWHEVAVLVRVNAMADTMRSVLERAGIPVRTRPGGADWSRAVSAATALTGREELTTWSCDILDSGEYDPREMDHVVATQVRAYLDAHRSGSVDGRGFSTWLATSGDVGDADGVDVLTFHAAKGREWPVVVAAGAEKGLMPHRSSRGPAARAEEARLAYVAFTRAADRLIVCWTDSREGRRTGPSPLLPALTTAAPVRDAPGEDFRRLVPRAAPVDPVAAALREWRDNRARSSRTSPDAVLTERQMESLLVGRPIDAGALERILGPVFARRFAGDLLPILGVTAGR